MRARKVRARRSAPDLLRVSVRAFDSQPVCSAVKYGGAKAGRLPYNSLLLTEHEVRTDV
ncbi:MAG: hypothetical protein ACREV3_11935 [Gammaproteobacteria bacterium]